MNRDVGTKGKEGLGISPPLEEGKSLITAIPSLHIPVDSAPGHLRHPKVEAQTSGRDTRFRENSPGHTVLPCPATSQEALSGSSPASPESRRYARRRHRRRRCRPQE